jgi:hypothetical protein
MRPKTLPHNRLTQDLYCPFSLPLKRTRLLHFDISPPVARLSSITRAATRHHGKQATRICSKSRHQTRRFVFQGPRLLGSWLPVSIISLIGLHRPPRVLNLRLHRTSRPPRLFDFRLYQPPRLLDFGLHRSSRPLKSLVPNFKSRSRVHGPPQPLVPCLNSQPPIPFLKSLSHRPPY